MQNWDDLRFFLAVARAGSIRGAAAQLAVNRSTVLRRISSLEQSLNARLFERFADGYVMTAAGEDLQRLADQVETVTLKADRQISGRDNGLAGTIRLSVPGALVSRLLMGEIVQFTKKHPKIMLELKTTYSMPDLVRRRADVAIVLSNDLPANLIGERVGTMARASYVATDLLSTFDEKISQNDFGWISWSSLPSAAQWREESEYPELPTTAVISDPFATLEAVKAGLGLAILPCFMADPEPKVSRVPGGRLQQHTDIWVLTHKDLQHTARVMLFIESLSQELNRNRDRLDGSMFSQ